MRRYHFLQTDAGPDDGVAVIDAEGRLRCADPPDPRWAEGLAADGPVGPDVVRIDVAQQVRLAEAALRERRRLFEESPSANYVAAADGRILECNAELVRLLGLGSEANAVGHPLFELYDDAGSRDAILEELAETGRVRGRETVLRRPDGEKLFTVQTVIADLDERGRIRVLRGYVVDRTQERRLEDQVMRAQKIEAVGRLAGGVAHDFNNLLTVILNYASLLEKRLDDQDPLARMVGEIRGAGERAAALTRRLLAFGQRQMIRPARVSLNEIVTSMLPLLDSAAGETVIIDVDLADDVGTVVADRGQLEQVLMNLVVNARDATVGGGRIGIKTEQVSISPAFRRAHPWALLGHHAVLIVSDSGVGMPREVLDHVFEPFFTTKEPGKGTGLGLASAYGIVKQHQGMIHAYSEPGRGTVMKVYLPLTSDKTARSSDSGPLGMPTSGSETLLLAEDDDAVRASLSETLTGHGYRVLSARNGEDAVRAFARDIGAVHLVLLDVVMPGMGGLAAYERIRKLSATVPVVLTSGFSSEAARITELEDEHVQFAAKPYAHEDLLGLIRRTLDAAD